MLLVIMIIFTIWFLPEAELFLIEVPQRSFTHGTHPEDRAVAACQLLTAGDVHVPVLNESLKTGCALELVLGAEVHRLKIIGSSSK